MCVINKYKMTTDESSENLEALLDAYLETLNEKEKKGYFIAKEHLGMSFQLEKSVGFLNWLATTNKLR